MSKEAISVTLDTDNLLWLKGRAKANRRRSVSDMLDQLIAAARANGHGPHSGSRSVIGTIDIDAADPLLGGADAAVRALFETSAQQPLYVHETKAPYVAARTRRRKVVPSRG